MEHLHPQKAYEDLRANPNALLIDCRTESEFYYVGHPVEAVNIEWNTEPDFVVNPHFCDEALRMAGRKDRPLVLICRSGKRSVEAGLELEKTVLRTCAMCSTASRASSTPSTTAARWAAGAKKAFPGASSESLSL